MESWYCRSLGFGERLYQDLRRLSVLRYQACPNAERPYRLAIDTYTAETLVFFAPEFSALASAFDAWPCEAPGTDRAYLRDLDFAPLPFTGEGQRMFQALAGV